MRTIAIGGNSRSVGKTSLAVSIIGATRDLDWTAVKMTQFGHGICSRDGRPCGCAVEDPLCPYEISEEHGEIPTTDTARMLAAGASEVLWVRTALGRLEAALPAIRQRLEGKRHVLFESTSLVGHWPPDVFLAVLDYQNLDIKESVIRLAPAADAFILPRTEHQHPPWPEFDATLVEQKPIFTVSPPSYCTPEIIEFAKRHLH